MTGALGWIRRGSGRRTAHRPDGGAALALTLFLIMLIGVLSLSIAAAVLVQTRPTQLQQKRTVTLAAAESGLAVALNRLRAASDPTRVYGLVNNLPCNNGDTLISGSVGSGAWNPRYEVKVYYFTSNPSQQDDLWRSANMIGCSSGHPSSTPLYALLKATGKGDAVPGQAAAGASRILETTYEFTVNNQNIPGGMLPIFASNAITTWCLSVDSAAVGQRVKVRTCQGLDTQKWSYTKDLLLQIQDAAGATYCMDIGTGSYLVLASCNANDVSEIWGYDGNKQFEGATAVNGTLTGSCLYATALSDGSSVKYGTCGSQIIPDASVGPGRAGEDMDQSDGLCRDPVTKAIVTTCTFQIVNYKYFGRCIDMTHQTVSSTWMIGYVCKETPGTQYIAWNQKFFWDATNGMFCTNTSGATVTTCGTPSSSLYCLYAGTSTGVTPMTRVLLKLCNRTDPSQSWDRTFKVGTNYAASYTIRTHRESTEPLCLELFKDGPPEASAIDKPWGTIIVNTCSGGTEQKWNAPPGLVTSLLQNTLERTSTP